MINAKVKVLSTHYAQDLEEVVNSFLLTIDVRQIIKTEYSSSSTGTTSGSRHSVIIYYVDIDDIRDIKIDNILDIK